MSSFLTAADAEACSPAAPCDPLPLLPRPRWAAATLGEALNPENSCIFWGRMSEPGILALLPM